MTKKKESKISTYAEARIDKIMQRAYNYLDGKPLLNPDRYKIALANPKHGNNPIRVGKNARKLDAYEKPPRTLYDD